MKQNSKEFPTYFPEHCPPCDAHAEEVKVYRLLKNNPAEKEDFLPHVLLNKNKKYNDIKAYGLSVYEDYEEVKNAMNLNPRLRKFKHIASGITYEYTGVIKNTPNPKQPDSSHITWWLYENVFPHEYFEVVKG